jgi:hypothetical protein
VDSGLLILLGSVLLVGLVFLAYISGPGRRRNQLDHDEFRQRWQRIQQLHGQGEAGWQLAIMEADKLLDQALRQSGYHGETMGERLKSARNVFRNNNEVWKAHKLRNRLAHEQDVHLNNMFANQALHGFEAGLKDLGAL